MRSEVNRKVHEGLIVMKIAAMKDKNEGDVSYIDPNLVLASDSMFARDGVHLNERGVDVLGKIVKEWVISSCVEYVRVD
jgi:lysophospholipase L1-like esterase